MKRDIRNCNDIELLRALCINYYHQFCMIDSYLVDESKMNISPEYAVREMREYLCSNQCELDLKWVKMKMDNEEIPNENPTSVDIKYFDKFLENYKKENKE